MKRKDLEDEIRDILSKSNKILIAQLEIAKQQRDQYIMMHDFSLSTSNKIKRSCNKQINDVLKNVVANAVSR